MTPELKTACELVFQEHKTSGYPINWNKNSFNGRISFGLSTLAKETLVNKNIIYTPNPGKKIITSLNPVVASATSFEEAEELIQNKVTPAITIVKEYPGYTTNDTYDFNSSTVKYTQQLLKIAGKAKVITTEIKWYMRPVFYYLAWPVCAAAVGALIAWLIGLAYMEFIFNGK